MLMPDNLTPVNNPFENIDLEILKQYTPMPQLNYIQTDIREPLIRPNPINETNRILEDQNERIDVLSNRLEQANSEISKQTNELQSIHYENMKLNAQIVVLNKAIDSQSDELENLRNINAKLKTANQSLAESNRSNKYYWIKTILIGIFMAFLGWILGKY